MDNKRTVKMEELKEVAKKMRTVGGDKIGGISQNPNSSTPPDLENGAPFSNPESVTGKGGGATICNYQDYSTY